MATIRAVIPAKLLPSCGQPPTPTKAEETVQGTIQATLPTAEVRYSEDAAEVVIQIADDEIVSALFGLAVYELQASPGPQRLSDRKPCERRSASNEAQPIHSSSATFWPPRSSTPGLSC